MLESDLVGLICDRAGFYLTARCESVEGLPGAVFLDGISVPSTRRPP
jgi:hypothetical protein